MPQNGKRKPCGPSNSAAALGEKLAGYLTDGADAVAFYAAVTRNEEIAGPAEALALIGSGIKGGIQFANGDRRGAAITLGSTFVGGALSRLLPKSVSPLNAASARFNQATANAFAKAGDKATDKLAESAVCGPE